MYVNNTALLLSFRLHRISIIFASAVACCLSLEQFCHGNWLPTVSYGHGDGAELNARLLLDSNDRGHNWYQHRHMPVRINNGAPVVGSTVTIDGSRHTVKSASPLTRKLFVHRTPETPASATEVNFDECSDVRIDFTGSFFHGACLGHCVDPTDKPRENLMCLPCTGLMQEQDFRERTQKRNEIERLGGFSCKTRSNLLPYDALLERTRILAEDYRSGVH